MQFIAGNISQHNVRMELIAICRLSSQFKTVKAQRSRTCTIPSAAKCMCKVHTRLAIKFNAEKNVAKCMDLLTVRQ